MPVRRHRPFAFLVALVLALALGACGTDDDTASSDSPVATSELSAEPLRVGASPVPHAEILRFVRDTLAKPAGLNIDIEEYTDYVRPNVDLRDGKLDANFFQVPGYLEQQAKELDAPLVAVVGVHVEPLGLYSRTIDDVADIPTGATVAIPKGAATVTRALKLLASGDLIELKDENADRITVADVTGNPMRLRFDAVTAGQTPRALDDDELAVINGNYALEAGLEPGPDALLQESTDDNPNVNLLVTVESKRDDPRVEKLGELLTSPQVKAFIEREYRGAVKPAF